MKMGHRFGVKLVLACFLIQEVNCLYRSDLYQYIQDISDPLVSPMESDTEVLEVAFGMYLLSIQKVDERTQVFSASMGVLVFWENKRLSWNASLYSNISSVYFPAEKVWFPRSVCIYNAVFVDKKCLSKDSTVLIGAEGWNMLAEYPDVSISCKMNLKYYPFDEQICTIIYINRMPLTDKLRFRISLLNKVDLSYFTKHAEWEVIDASLELKDMFNDLIDDKQLLIHIRLKRMPFLAVCSNLLPVWILSALNVVCFLIPVKCGEKLGTCMSIFLTFAVFLTVMKEFMPQASDEVSYFLVYLFTQLTVSGLVVVLEAIVLRVHHQEEDSRLIANESKNKTKRDLTIKNDTKLNKKHIRISSATLEKMFGILVISMNISSLVLFLIFTLLAI